MNVEKEGVLCNKEYNPVSESQLYFLPPACSPGLSTRQRSLTCFPVYKAPLLQQIDRYLQNARAFSLFLCTRADYR